MIIIVDYGVGNLTSIQNMFKRLSISACCSNNPEAIAAAQSLLLPGVGHFDSCLRGFNNSGLRPIIEQKAAEGCPILGICVGAQMMTRGSEEGQEPGLGWVGADTVRFDFAEKDLPVPHMGWNELEVCNPSPLWSDLPGEPRFYFAHSYHFRFDDAADVTGQAYYGHSFPCAFRKNNIFGVQFHPEKSHIFGMKVLQNFAGLAIADG
jgi:glutamine amidotransferase